MLNIYANSYRAETTLNYGMERAWSIACTPDANKVAVGYDEGTVVLKLGNEQPVASLDQATGKIVWAVNNEIQTANLKGTGATVNRNFNFFFLKSVLFSCIKI
jgi:coatomer subunit beta'